MGSIGFVLPADVPECSKWVRFSDSHVGYDISRHFLTLHDPGTKCRALRDAICVRVPWCRVMAQRLPTYPATLHECDHETAIANLRAIFQMAVHPPSTGSAMPVT